jgi:hypothetical protein
MKRTNVKALRPACPLLVAILAKLQIKCDFSSGGCRRVLRLEQLEAHVKGCRFEREMIIMCDKGCGAQFKRKNEKTHCCVEYLRGILKKVEAGHREVTSSRDRLERELEEARIQIKATNCWKVIRRED